MVVGRRRSGSLFDVCCLFGGRRVLFVVGCSLVLFVAAARCFWLFVNCCLWLRAVICRCSVRIVMCCGMLLWWCVALLLLAVDCDRSWLF